YVVGGLVRDWLLSRDTADIDIAVNADAPGVAREIANVIGGKYVLLDEANGVARVVATEDERVLYLDFSSFSGNIGNDLGRRDFTIDAMAVELARLVSGQTEVIDPFHGQVDLKSKLIRAVNERVFAEDAVRLLRAVRLAAELGFAIESNTEKLIKGCVQLVNHVPGEKVREELLRLFALPGAAVMVRYMDELGLLTGVMPELDGMKGVEQPKEHYWNVFNHSVETVATVEFVLRESQWKYGSDDLLSITPWSAEISRHFGEEISSGSNRRVLLKLGGLLHDIAKPATKTTEETGKTRFLGHGKIGASMAAAILARLRFSSRESRLVENLIYHHLRPAQMSNEGLPTRRAVFRYFRDTEGAGIDILFLALADYLATGGPNLDVEQWKQHNHVVNYVLAEHARQEAEVMPVKLIDGHDIMDVLGISPGPLVGELLTEVREAQAAGELNTKEDAIALVRMKIEKRHCSAAC
ncbi:MAG: CCA tRNA nucleotidyltransferase, partial [Chloroflexi bacterium]|nr:CCA tRNA nucleotidyltransferase [Chloroflexota bacterium]